MILLFTIGFIGLTVNAVFFNGRSKLIRYGFLAVLFILFVYITMDPNLTFDTSIYNFYYTDPDLAHFEVGYIWLMKLGKLLGLSFYHFRGLLFVLEMTFILLALHRFKIKNVNLFLVLYTILIFFESPIQLRNYLMASIVLFAFSFARDKTRLGCVNFLIFIGIGATIQSSAVFFLPFVMFFLLRRTLVNRIIVLYTAIFIALIILGPVRSVVSLIVGKLLAPFGVIGMKAANYLNRLIPGQIILADVTYTLGVQWFFSQTLSKYQFSNDIVSVDLKKNIVLAEKVFFFLIYMFPMYLFAYNFNRILIDSFPIFFIGIISLSENLKGSRDVVMGIDKFAVIGIVVTMIYSIFSYLYGLKYVGTFLAVLFHNTFLGGIY